MPYKPKLFEDSMLPHNRMVNVRRRVNRAKNFPVNTCPASRHVHIMANNLTRYGKDYLLDTEPEHCAGSLYSVLESLWKARTELSKLRRKIAHQSLI